MIMTCRLSGSHTRPPSITKRPIPRYKPLTMHKIRYARRSTGKSADRDARQNGVDNAQRCLDFACSWSDPNNESTFTILCARRPPRGLERLQHRERNGHVEPAGEAFRPAIDRCELARAGSLPLPREEPNRVVPDIQRSRRIPHSDWSLPGHS
jgi:hypothetical protein